MTGRDNGAAPEDDEDESSPEGVSVEEEVEDDRTAINPVGEGADKDAAPRDSADDTGERIPASALAEGDDAARDALVAATSTNPGAPFALDVVRDLAVLKRTNLEKFIALRSRLKRARCGPMAELDRAIAKETKEDDNDGERQGRPPSQADILVALAEDTELFQTPDEVAAADIEINGRRETHLIKSSGYRRWLKRRFYEELHKAPTGEAVAMAIGVIEAKALHETPVKEVFVRVGMLDDKIYLDLCDATWRAVEIDATGWRIAERPDIRFRRSPDMRPLPEPARSGEVDGLRPLLNIPVGEDGEADLIMAVAFLLGCLRARGPYPIMAIGGEQGSAKSTRTTLLRSVIDPRNPALRALPRDERDLVIAARKQHVMAFDNASGIQDWLSDALCRIASGAGFGTRELHTDQDEVLFSGARPIILNGIEEIVARPDLAERTIFATCKTIDSKDRLSEDEVWASFNAAHASVLGALLDAVAMGLNRFPIMERPRDLPRMADFAHWTIACEAALWKDGDFMCAYDANILGAVESVLEASPVAVAVRTLVSALAVGTPPTNQWGGTATELLVKLTALVDDRVSRARTWPGSGRVLAGALRRAASFLRKIEIDIDFSREGHARARQITITGPGLTTSPSAPSAPASPIFASARSSPSALPQINNSGSAGADAADAKQRNADTNENRPSASAVAISDDKSSKIHDAAAMRTAWTVQTQKPSHLRCGQWGEMPDGAPRAAPPPLSGVLVDGDGEPIPESILKMATAARAAMAEVEARAAAAEKTRADNEQSAAKRRAAK